MSSSSWIKVFVYGTLKSGEPNHHWLTSPLNGVSKFLCTGRTTDTYPLVIETRFNIPLLLNKKGIGNHIEGEIYEIDEDMFGKLDNLEQYPEYYDREIHNIVIDDGTVIPCWMYLIKDFNESMLSEKMFSFYTNSEEYPYSKSYVNEL